MVRQVAPVIIEAAINGILICGLYLPNGNPRPGPKYDFKLKWFERLDAHLRTLIDLDAPVVCLGDFNVMPTDLDVYAPDRWRDDARCVGRRGSGRDVLGQPSHTG